MKFLNLNNILQYKYTIKFNFYNKNYDNFFIYNKN